MRYVMTLLISLAGCSTMASNAPTPPSGEEVFDALLMSLDIKLSEEPLCNMESATRKNPEITLGQHLSTILAESYNSDNVSTLKSYCLLSKFEDNFGNVSDAWDCNLHINESNDKKEFISSSTIAFIISLDQLELVPGSLRCF